MRYITEYLPIVVWIPCFSAVVLFVFLALRGARRGWRRPTVRAFGIAVVALVGMAVVLGSRETAGTEETFFTIRSMIDLVLGAGIVVVGPALAFHALRRRSATARAVGAVLALLVSLPVAFVVELLIACSGGGGCI